MPMSAPSSPGPLVCLRCDLPVERSAGLFESHARMHWVCFHYMFEHGAQPSAGPDIACAHPRCPDPSPGELEARETPEARPGPKWDIRVDSHAGPTSKSTDNRSPYPVHPRAR